MAAVVVAARWRCIPSAAAFHSGQLADAQAPQFLLVSGGRTLLGNLGVLDGVTIDGVDISLHRDDLNIHHDKATAGNGIEIVTGSLSPLTWRARHRALSLTVAICASGRQTVFCVTPMASVSSGKR